MSENSPTGKLTPEQLDQFLRQPINARLGTVTPEGYPYVIPIWTEYDGEAIWLVSLARSRHAQNMLANPKVSLSIATDDAALVRVVILGRAELVQGPGPLNGRMLEVGLSMRRRYTGLEDDPYSVERKTWPRCLFRIVPEEIISWGGPVHHPKYS